MRQAVLILLILAIGCIKPARRSPALYLPACENHHPKTGYLCVLVEGHRGKHVARDRNGKILATWETQAVRIP